MDIIIEAPGHNNQEELHLYYRDKLNREYGSYTFIASMKLLINKEKNNIIVSINVDCKGNKDLFAKAESANEKTAFIECVNKINRQVEKYKQVTYHH